MSQSLDIELNVKANTSQFEQQIMNVGNSVNNLNNSIVDSANPNLAYPTSAGGVITSTTPILNPQSNHNQQKNQNEIVTNSFAKLNEASQKMIENFGMVTESLNIFNQNLRNSDTQQNKRDNLNQQQEERRKKEEDKKESQRGWREGISAVEFIEKITGVISGISKGHLAYTQQAITGDVAGANLTANDTRNNAIKGIGGVMAGAGAMTGLLPLTLIGGITSLVGTGLDILNDRNKESHAYALQYKQALPQLTSVGATFGGENVRNKSAQQNANDEIRNWSRLVHYNRGTGMDNAAFTQLATSMGQYGITNLDVAGNMAQQSAKWARFTGGDASQFADFMGKMTRYGSQNAVDDVGYAYSAAKNSGLTKNQMPEFLRGLQTVIEDGISKGYVKSTKDVSDTLTMFGKMSGNHVSWTGQQGANKLMTMNAGLANATNLSSPAQILAYQAFANKDTTGKDWHIEGAGAYNTFALMEEGAKSGNVRDVIGSVKNAYGGDVQQQIEAIKQIYGLNNIGAMQLLKYSQSSGFTEAGAKNIVEKGDYKNNETKMYDALSKINEAVVNLGKSKFELELKDTDKYLQDIYKLLEDEFNKEKRNEMKQEVTTGKGFRQDTTVVRSSDLNGNSQLVIESQKWNEKKLDKYFDFMLGTKGILTDDSQKILEKVFAPIEKKYTVYQNGHSFEKTDYEVNPLRNKVLQDLYSRAVDMNINNLSMDGTYEEAQMQILKELSDTLKKFNITEEKIQTQIVQVYNSN